MSAWLAVDRSASVVPAEDVIGPTQAEKDELLRAVDEHGKQMKELGIIKRMPRAPGYVAAALAVLAGHFCSVKMRKVNHKAAACAFGVKRPTARNMNGWLQRLRRLRLLTRPAEKTHAENRRHDRRAAHALAALALPPPLNCLEQLLLNECCSYKVLSCEPSCGVGFMLEPPTPPVLTALAAAAVPSTAACLDVPVQ